jgi:hypothetical protein
MKKRGLALLLSAAVAIACLCAPVLAAGGGTHSYKPVYIGDAETDYLADQVLLQIPTAGKTDAGKIGAVYDWIETHCVRTEWDGKTLWFDQSETASHLDAYAQTAQSQLDSGAASMRTEYASDDGGFLSDDSNAYICAFARDILYTRTGNCAHFATLLALLLSHLGYDCRVINGVFVNLDGSQYEHVWDCVLVDGQYYWLDIRMDQANYVRTGSLSRQYFMVADKASWQKSHEWDEQYSDWLFANAAKLAEETELQNAWSRCSDWAETYLSRADAKKLIPYAMRGADMTKPISRAEFAAAAVKLYEALSGKTAPDGGAVFSDTSDPDVLRAAALGVVGGVGNGKFAPAAALTREQAAAMLGRVCELVKTGSIGTGEALDAQPASFTDAAKISAYARAYIGYFYEKGVIDGVGAGAFAPQGTLTREQALKIACVCTEKGV